jgi:hypothetical protein
MRLAHRIAGRLGLTERRRRERTDFESDPEREKFFFTFNPRGYLRRKDSPDDPMVVP